MVPRLMLSADQNYWSIKLPVESSEQFPDMVLSTGKAGDMSVTTVDGRENRNQLFKLLGFETSRVASLSQVHSQRVLLVDDGNDVLSGEGDGLITGNNKNILSVTVADCVPVFLCTRGGQAFGLVHSGWKGTGIAEKGVDLMKKQFSLEPEGITAVIGPSIGPCCYDVDSERGEMFAEKWGKEHVMYRNKKWYLDLKKANAALLKRAGIKNIFVLDNCTCCESEFGSFRREGSSGFTKMVALIGYFK